MGLPGLYSERNRIVPQEPLAKICELPVQADNAAARVVEVRQNSIGLKVIDYSAGSLQTSNHDRDIAVAGNSD